MANTNTVIGYLFFCFVMTTTVIGYFFKHIKLSKEYNINYYYYFFLKEVKIQLKKMHQLTEDHSPDGWVRAGEQACQQTLHR